MNTATRIGVDPTSRDYEFWDNYPGIVWSNPEAPDSVMIANALLQGRKKVLAAVATRFGGHRLREEWEHLRNEAPAFPEIQKVIAPKLAEINGLVEKLEAPVRLKELLAKTIRRKPADTGMTMGQD